VIGIDLFGLGLEGQDEPMPKDIAGDPRFAGAARAMARCSAALAPWLAEPAPATPMRLSILRETRMPAVWCRIGPGPAVVPRAPHIASALADAITDWCVDPGLQ